MMYQSITSGKGKQEIRRIIAMVQHRIISEEEGTRMIAAVMATRKAEMVARDGAVRDR